MADKYQKLEDWLVEPERDRIEALYDDLSDPHHVYLAVRHFVDDSIAPDEFIMKIGISRDARRRAAQLGRDDFELHAFGEFSNKSIALAVEHRLLKDDDYGKPVQESVRKHLEIDSTECKVFTVESYHYMVDTLNQFFDDNPYPRFPEA